jgi:hypothetical protein
MLETELFKENYYLGRMAWIKGPIGSQKLRIAREMLKECDVTSSEIKCVSVVELILLFRLGAPKVLLSQFKVLLIRSYGDESDFVWGQFLKILSGYQTLRFELGLRFVFVSDEDEEWGEGSREIDASRFVGFCFQVTKVPGNSMSLDLRFHALLKKACQISGKGIHRISEQSAELVESLAMSCNDDHLLLLIIQGVQKSQDKTLRLEEVMDG